ncbi:MAG TPA: hypothetical protein PK390_02210 [Fervidobacterium nodosum]|nr:hypothetical protein [Fervidobacterium nodosum]
MKEIILSSGRNVAIYTYYNNECMYLDNVFAFEFVDNQNTQPVNDFSSVYPSFYSSSKRIITGIISFSMHF